MEELDSKKSYKLKKFIKNLDSIRASHTEFISVYIPKGYELNKIIKHLEEEQGTASNIKSKVTKTNVIDSLERMIRHLRLYKRTPPNGLAVFSGNLAAKEGKKDFKVFSIEPPIPLNTRLYRCDQTFVLDLLHDQLEHHESYGLIVLDKREANTGLLKGNSVIQLSKLTSGVPGKYKTGGQCLSSDTLIMKEDGDLIKIKEAHNPLLVTSENFNLESTEQTPIIAKWENRKCLYRLTTYYPRIEIKSSKDHLFFIRTENGIEEKPLSEIKKGDYLIMPEKINLNLKYQKIDFIPQIKSTRNLKKIEIPSYLDEDLARILGYYLGDGSYEIDRLTFFEQRKEVSEFYKRLMEKVFDIEVKYKFRESKNYHQLRIYSRIISQLFKKIFGKDNKTLTEKIPSIILKSPASVLANFVAGFYDAEGYISNHRIGLGINNKFIIKQLQFCLLRLGIISSMWEYDNRKNPYSNNYRYTLSIEDIKSLEKFRDLIGFSSKEKQNKIINTIKEKSKTSKIRQLVVNGKEIARILRNSGYNTTQFSSPLFFVNKRQMSKEVFKMKILDKINDKELKRRLEMFYNSNLIVVKISNIEKLKEDITVDIETKNQNFIANGLIVHNSAARFARLREEAAHVFYKRIADIAKKEFLNKKDIKGILVGGPGHTKQEFVDGDFLPRELKDKVLALKDLTYTDEFGLNELVEKSKDELAQTSITKEKEILNRFFTMLAKQPEKTTYGLKETKKALEMGAVETLILSDSLEDIEQLEDLAENSGAQTEIVSTETQEGIQLKNLGEIGAILRFALS